MNKNIFLIVFITVILSASGARDSYALFPTVDESGTTAVVRTAEEQREEKAIIAQEVRAKKEEAKEKNARLVSQVKARMAAQTQAASRKEEPVARNVNLIVIIIAVLFFVGLRLMKKRR